MYSSLSFSVTACKICTTTIGVEPDRFKILRKICQSSASCVAHWRENGKTSRKLPVIIQLRPDGLQLLKLGSSHKDHSLIVN